MRIILEHDSSGNIIDSQGFILGNHPTGKGYEPESLSVKDVLALKEAGFSSEEIIEMRKAGAL
tara:strand:+ start:22131 stop:22319 length:189 start_codon:yes stop_codon:yes gene_type:complete